MYLICINEEVGSTITKQDDVNNLVNAITQNGNNRTSTTGSDVDVNGIDYYFSSKAHTGSSTDTTLNAHYTYSVDNYYGKKLSVELWKITDNSQKESTDNGEWYDYEGLFTVPNGQHLTRFMFASTSTGTTTEELTYGNFLDAVTFTSEFTNYKIEYYKYDSTKGVYTIDDENTEKGYMEWGETVTAAHTDSYSSLNCVASTYGEGYSNKENKTELPDALSGYSITAPSKRTKESAQVSDMTINKYNDMNTLRLYYVDNTATAPYTIEYYVYKQETDEWEIRSDLTESGNKTHNGTVSAGNTGQLLTNNNLVWSSVGVQDSTEASANNGSTSDLKAGTDRLANLNDNGTAKTDMTVSIENTTNVLKLYYIPKETYTMNIKYYVYNESTGVFEQAKNSSGAPYDEAYNDITDITTTKKPETQTLSALLEENDLV